MDLALFDFDNTITRSDTFTAFVKQTVTPFRQALFSPVLAPFILAYKADLLAASTLRQIIVFCGFRGMDTDVVDAMGKHFSAHFIASQLDYDALDKLNWHKTRGDKIVVVSASLDIYLLPWCEKMGFELLSSALETDIKGRYTGRYQGNDCCNEDKAKRVVERFDLRQFDKIYAYGDSDEDKEMLRLADYPFLNWQPADLT